MSEKTYRHTAGIALFNKKGHVLLGKAERKIAKNRQYAWQMPQGGIEKGELQIDAALRELHEETGITADSVEILKTASSLYSYDFPEEVRNRLGTHFYGQEMHWVALRFLGEDSMIDVLNCPDPCFCEWKWVPFDQTPDLVIPFKRDVYRAVVEEFKNLI